MPPKEKEQLEGMVTTETATILQEPTASDRKEALRTKRSRRKKGSSETEAPKAGGILPAVLESNEPAAKLKKRAAHQSVPVNAGTPMSEPGIAASVDITEDIPAEEPPAAPIKTQGALLQLLKGPLKKKERNETHEPNRVYIRKDLKKRLNGLAEHRSKGFKTLLLNYGLERALDELELALKDDAK